MLASGHMSARRIGPKKASLLWKLSNLPNILRGGIPIVIAKLFGIPTHYGMLWARLIRANGECIDYGLISTRVVTDAYVAALTDCLQSAVAAFSDYKYHDSGTGTNAEAAGDTTLQTVCTDNLRTVGTQIEGATANVYKSVGTIAYTGTRAITEHGLFNNTRASGGTLMDRSVFSAINVVSGDSIEFTYQLTNTSGG
jgi:hypothetical protein